MQTCIPEMEFMKVQFCFKKNLDISQTWDFFTFLVVFQQNAIHEQTRVFFIDWSFCIDFWDQRAVMVFY
jgi:hypothetical protein